MLSINQQLSIPLEQIELSAIRAQGSGGQNVNKTSTAIHLRFDIQASSLPDEIKQRLLARRDQRISIEGVVVIKAQQHRSQEQNREAALQRLRVLVAAAAAPPVPRKVTKTPRAAKRRRVDEKVQRGRVKSLRSKPED